MSSVVVVFESESSRLRVKETLERDGIIPAACLPSGSAVLRTVLQLGDCVVVSGFRLRDMSVIELAASLPVRCMLLVMSSAMQLDLCGDCGLYKLPSPATATDLIAAVRMLMLQLNQQSGSRIMRPEQEHEIIANAKILLMEQREFSEQEAHRHLQRMSMKTGKTIVEIANSLLQQ